MSLLVPDAVAGEIEKQEVVTLPLREEPGDCFANNEGGLIAEFNNLVELSDLRISQDGGQGADIDIGRRETRQAGILVATVANDEREPPNNGSTGVVARRRQARQAVTESAGDRLHELRYVSLRCEPG